MNSLLIYPSEDAGNGQITLVGARAEYVSDFHALTPGARVTAILRGGRRGFATVQTCSRERIELELELTEEPLARTPLEVIVAVPRPQTVRKVIQACAILGVSALHFLRAERTDKNYLDASILQSENIELEVVKGMEQAIDSIPPEVHLHERFRPFLEDTLPGRIDLFNEPPLCLLPHTGSIKTRLSDVALSSYEQPIFLGIGPEAGWNDFEVSKFEEAGFIPISLGKRVLRVELALTTLLGQLDLLRNQQR